MLAIRPRMQFPKNSGPISFSMNGAILGYAHWILCDDMDMDASKRNSAATGMLVFDFELFIGVILDN